MKKNDNDVSLEVMIRYGEQSCNNCSQGCFMTKNYWITTSFMLNIVRMSRSFALIWNFLQINSRMFLIRISYQLQKITVKKIQEQFQAFNLFHKKILDVFNQRHFKNYKGKFCFNNSQMFKVTFTHKN